MARKTFDRVAPFYPLLERLTVGGGLEAARRAFLPDILTAKRTLLVGEGNGRFLAECLGARAVGAFTVIDSSPRMLSLLGERVAGVAPTTRLDLVCQDVRDWQPPNVPFDAIVTHFLLDLFRPASQRRVVETLTRAAHPGTLWVNVDYQPRCRTWWFRAVDWMQYRFDRLVSGVEADRHYDPAPVIAQAGWSVAREEPFCGGNVVARMLVRGPAADAPATASRP